VGTIGNVGGYYIGRQGEVAVYAHTSRITPEQIERLRILYGRWGSRFLIFTAIPVLGTVLPITAGVFGVELRIVIFWVYLAKATRNLLLVFLFGQALRTLF